MKMSLNQSGRTSADALLKPLGLWALMLLLFTNVALGAQLDDKRISMNLKNVTLKEAISEIMKSSSYGISYSVDEVDKIRDVSLKVDNVTVEEALSSCLSKYGMKYTISNNTVVISAVKQNPVGGGKISSSVIKGHVCDTEGVPLIGVTVRTLNNASGTTTDLDGNFTLASTGTDVQLVISYIGKKSVELKAVPGKLFKVVLEDNETSMKEVVVTGVVTKKRDTFTGSTSTFTREELKSVGTQNPIASLKSLDPSFAVLENNQYGSDPNRLPDVEVRGKSSMLGMRDEVSEDPNQPLFILDGFETTLETIYNMDINRIASMTILKDAASTAIYGSKAANGVVVVETIKPKTGQLRLSYSGSLNISFPDLSSYNMMNAAEKLEFERLAGRYTSDEGSSKDFLLSQIYNQRLSEVQSGVDTYWLADPVRTGINHKHDLYAEGGEGGFMFGIGLNYNGTSGVMKESDRNLLGGNLDIIYRVNKLQFTNKFSAQQTKSNNPIVGFSDYVDANPYYTKYNDEGGVDKWLQKDDFAKSPNPLWNASQTSRDEEKKLLISDYFIAEYNPSIEMKLRVRFGLTHITDNKDLFYSPNDTRFEEITDRTQKGSYKGEQYESTKYEGEITATYAKVLAEKHQFNLAIGGQISEQKTLTQGYSAIGFPDGDFTYPSFANGYPTNGRPAYYEELVRAVSGYFTGGYAFDNKYLMDFNYRMNGSNTFGSNKKFTNTWAIGLGWNIHQEKFIKEHIDGISMLKIRASIGNPGNQNFQSDKALRTFQYSYIAYNYFGLGTTLYQLGNKNLKWQNTIDKNIGMDITLFNDRLNIVWDYFHKTTDPLLITIGLPASSGISTYPTNLGKQITKGFTGSVRYYIIRNLPERLTWSVRGNIRMLSYKLDGIGDQLGDLNKYGQENKSTKRYYDGADPDDIWAVRSAGIDPATGRELLIKKDGTYTYDFSYADEEIVGNSRPKAEGTIGSNFGWKGFTAGVTFRYRYGGKTFNEALYNKVENLGSDGLNYNQDKRALYSRWQNPGDIVQFKDIADSSSSPMTSRFVQKDNTFTLESFQIGYEFENELAHALGFSSLRLNAYMNDIFRISSIKAERGTSYPFSRSVSFALSFTL